MNTRKQCEKSRKRSLRFIESGKWFKEFAHAEHNKDLNVMALLRFNWGLDDSAKTMGKVSPVSCKRGMPGNFSNTKT